MGGDDITVKMWLRKVRVGRVLEDTVYEREATY